MAQDVKKREDEKKIELKGRQWVVEKLSAQDAMYLIYQIISYALPPMLTALIPQMGLPFGDVAAMASQSGKPMSKAEFIQFQNELLRCVYEILPSGRTAVIGDNGEFGVVGLEKDAFLLGALTIHSLVFNAASFFGEEGLSGILPDPSTSNL